MIVIALSVIAWKFTVSTVAYQRRVSAARIKIITVTIVSIFLANQRRVTATRIKDTTVPTLGDPYWLISGSYQRRVSRTSTDRPAVFIVELVFLPFRLYC